jgi:hypothetical protein
MMDWIIPAAYANEYPVGNAELSLDAEVIAQIESDQYTVDSVAAGPHTLTVELVGHDGGSLQPPVFDSVSFTAE